jgi:hypothetical protein
LIEEMLATSPAATFAPSAEDETAVQVERGVVLAMAMAGADAAALAPVVERLRPPAAAALRVTDAAGHARPRYPGLLVYAWRHAAELIATRSGPAAAAALAVTEAWHRRLHQSFERALERARPGVALQNADPAARVDAAWAALAVGQPLAWLFAEIVDAQQPSGALMPLGPSQNPETYWHHELVLLHALAAHAARTGDAAAAGPRRRAARFHLYETQPDHATNEPWGLLAFVRATDANPIADGMLHAARVHHPAGPQGVTRILLADTLNCLHLLLKPRPA